MICNQLMEATTLLSQLNPSPAPFDVARLLCGGCNRTDSCPGMTLDQAEQIKSQRSPEPSQQ